MIMIYVLTGLAINGTTAIILRRFFPLQHIIEARAQEMKSGEEADGDSAYVRPTNSIDATSSQSA